MALQDLPKIDIRSHPTAMRLFWFLVEDFFEQPIVMKLFLMVGWLAILLMGLPALLSLVGMVAGGDA